MNINNLIAIVKEKLKKKIIMQDIKIEDKSFLHVGHKGNDKKKFHLKILINSKELSKMSRIQSNKKIKSDFNYMRQFKFNHKDIKAFEILGLSVGMKWMKIQEKFKTLVKKFHPDMNLGNKKYEEKLKLITLAYTQLKNTYREKIDT